MARTIVDITAMAMALGMTEQEVLGRMSADPAYIDEPVDEWIDACRQSSPEAGIRDIENFASAMRYFVQREE